MDLVMILLVGLMTGVAAWLMMSSNLLNFLIGLGLLGNAVNLAIFQSGRLTFGAPPFVEEGQKMPVGEVANALPQALILTAIVIGFGLLAFSLILVYRLYAIFGTIEVDEIEAAEVREP